MQEETVNNKLEDYFWNKTKVSSVHKWHHYFKIYERHFKKFIGKNPSILEIGVQEGGSLEMWNYYFDGNCQIYGVDIDEACLDVVHRLNCKNIHISIGDQNDREFWKNFLKGKLKFDIVIDDGGHMMSQQIVTYEELINHVSDVGVYLCEDLHTSYWSLYGGKLKNPDTFVEYSKNFVDMLNYHHIPKDDLDAKSIGTYMNFRKRVKSVHYYDSVIVLELYKDEKAPVTSIKN